MQRSGHPPVTAKQTSLKVDYGMQRESKNIFNIRAIDISLAVDFIKVGRIAQIIEIALLKMGAW